ncbi:MAG: hypothetical protein WCF79_24475, partial [Rhodomicrobium sp.]
GSPKADPPTRAQTPATLKPGGPLMRKQHPLAWPGKPTDFATSHCMKCAAGWTRGGQGANVVVCLLDREPVFTNMTSRNRFEPKQKHPAPKRAPYRQPRRRRTQ